MPGGAAFDERDVRHELAAAIYDLRSLLRAFDEVEPAAMVERFYIHAINELDLAGRTVVYAFDRDRGLGGAR